jgi:hypothetical protein
LGNLREHIDYYFCFGTYFSRGNFKMNSYFVLVRYDNNPGAGVYRAYINAENPHQAIAAARSMYGRLLLSEAAVQVN